ncbi:MAG: cysteine desulfurase/selenocysteine lyase [Myxococcota bacterium]|jgi:cysteine desulfurase/selenocysteine lyase
MSISHTQLQRLRKNTPGCADTLHFNNAGAALPSREVLAVQQEHLAREAAIGAYEAAAEATERREAVYDTIAALVGGHRDEIALVESATRAWQLAFYAFTFQPGDRILTSVAEYGSNFIAYLQVARRTGAVVEVVPDDADGQLDVAALRKMIDDRTRLVSVTHVPTNGGLVNPAAAIGAVTREAGVPYLLDACQSVGQMPVDVEQIGCDMLSATGRKYLRAPRGTGFLWIRRSLLQELEPPLLDAAGATWSSRDGYTLKETARRFECWEHAVAGRLGLAVAAEEAMSIGLDCIYARTQALAERLRAQLTALRGVTVHDKGRERCGIVTFTVEGLDPEEIRSRLRAQRMNIWLTHSDMTRLDMDARDLPVMARASVHFYNTDDEVDRFCLAVDGLR